MNLEVSAFDSQHYDLHIARLLPAAGDGEPQLERVVEAARRQSFDVAFLRILDTDALRDVLARRGEQAVDTLITSRLGTARHGAPRGVGVTHHDRLDGADVDAAAAITAETITTSHLHADPRLPLARTHALFAAWGRNDVTGRAQHVVVTREGTALVGYISLVVRGTVAMIDLVAVATAHHGRGLGSAMLAEVISWVDEQRLDVTVGTQASNPALRLYARHGFVPVETHLTYHLWLK